MIKLLIMSPFHDAVTLDGVAAPMVRATNRADGNLTSAGLASIHATCVSRVGHGGYDAIEICGSAPEVLDAVVKARGVHGPVGLLDLIGHGAAGLQKIGDQHLFEASPRKILAGGGLPARLRPLLAPFARLRLLGCNTGRDRRGRILLAKLGRMFEDEVTVYGTLDRITPAHFEGGEFSQAQELLFSSEAALDREAPDADYRSHTLTALANVEVSQG